MKLMKCFLKDYSQEPSDGALQGTMTGLPSGLVPRLMSNSVSFGTVNEQCVNVVLDHHADLVRDHIRGVEAHAQLADHGNVATSIHGLHESFRARVCTGAHVEDELVLCHANAGVYKGDRGVSLI